MSMWNERYGDAGFVYGTEPNDFLRASVTHLPRGRVLCLAEGEGRNAVYLAKLGYEVHAIDLSPVGLAKAAKLAAREHVSITTEVADLGTVTLEPGYWTGIVSIWAHMPRGPRKALHSQVIRALAPGGVFILEAYTPRQLTMQGVGGPSQAEMLMSLDALREELHGLEFVHACEIDREVSEGTFHQGRSAVVQVIARKA